MSNFYTKNEDILFHMKNMDLNRIVNLKEDNFSEKEEFPYAPKDYEDTLDNYHRVLEIVGEIAGEFIAPRSAQVDEDGAQFIDGEVKYAKGTTEALDRLKKADLMGFTIPRKYGGINMPKIIYTAAIEMISRADASLMNIFGLQEIAETIFKYGSADQKDRFLPRFTSGEVTASMALTEPDAGSDLQAVMLKAFQDSNGDWKLNGVKRFITNGCGEISLVMARSEHGSSDGRGLSLFVYERDKDMIIRRIEHKLGIKGSPTCEIQFNNAKAELLGKRRMGLIKYTMSLMNGARLGVSAQSLGIAEAAYSEAYKYANERTQFKKPIKEFTAVYEMLTDMKVNIEAVRSLLYETSRIVDIKEGIEEAIEHHPERKADLSDDLKRYNKFTSLYTPIIKAFAAETCNKISYDGIQIHGGVGFTTEFNAERHYRDARITNIYEGTTQLQVVAAIGGVTSGVVFERLNEYENNNDFKSVANSFEISQRLRTHLEASISHVKEINDPEFLEYHSRRLVEMSTDVILSYLLCIDGTKCDRKKKIAETFVSKAKIRVQSSMDYIISNDKSVIENHDIILKQ